MFLVGLTYINTLLNNVPETLALLIFGVFLVGAGLGLRRLLRRYDAAVETAKKDLTEKREAATTKH
jgi:membrane protein required for beta-lactamase induction